MRCATHMAFVSTVLGMGICCVVNVSGARTEPEVGAIPAPATQPVDAAAMLRKPLPEVELNRVPLSDVIDGLNDLTSANLTLNRVVIKAAGVDFATPVTLRAVNLTLADALENVLRPFAAAGLTYRADSGAIWISTQADLDHLAAFQARHAVALSARGPLTQRLRPDPNQAAGRPNAWLPGARLKQILDDLAQRGGVEIQDLNALAQVGITGREFIRLQLPDPTLRDALTEALWKTGRINEVDVQVDGKTVKLLPRVKANAG